MVPVIDLSNVYNMLRLGQKVTFLVLHFSLLLNEL